MEMMTKTEQTSTYCSLDEHLRDLLSRVLYKPLEVVTPDARLMEELSADSLDLFDCAHAIEDELGITVEPGEIDPGFTVADLARWLEQRRLQSATSSVSANPQSCSNH
jgi:acyl carrier protein